MNHIKNNNKLMVRWLVFMNNIPNVILKEYEYSLGCFNRPELLKILLEFCDKHKNTHNSLEVSPTVHLKEGNIETLEILHEYGLLEKYTEKERYEYSINSLNFLIRNDIKINNLKNIILEDKEISINTMLLILNQDISKEFRINICNKIIYGYFLSSNTIQHIYSSFEDLDMEFEFVKVCKNNKIDYRKSINGKANMKENMRNILMCAISTKSINMFAIHYRYNEEFIDEFFKDYETGEEEFLDYILKYKRYNSREKLYILKHIKRLSIDYKPFMAIPSVEQENQ